MAGWVEMALAGLVFLASHALPVRPAVRRRLTGWLGEIGYLVVYAAVSLATLAWLIVAAGRAPYVALWPFALWQLWVPNIAMPLACLLAAYGVAAPNPLSFAARRAGLFDPDRPGIAGVARHPVLWALALWSAAHAVPNGNLAHLLLFGGFAVFALLGMVAIDRRLRSRLGAQEWHRLARCTSFLPGVALLAGRWRPRRLGVDPVRLAVATAAWLLLIWGHTAVIGVSPLPVW